MKKRRYWGIGIGLLVFFLIVGFIAWKFTVGQSKDVVISSEYDVVVASKNADSTGKSYEELAATLNVPPNKVWEISYPSEIKEATVNSNSVYILNSKGEKENIDIEVKKEKLIINPPSRNYKEGKLYTLYIEKEVQLLDQNQEKKSTKMDFIIERKKVNKVKVNKDLVNVEKEKVIEQSENQLVLESDKSINKIKKGEILVIPTNDPEKPSVAHKVVKVEKNKSELVIETEAPIFSEIVPEMNVFETFNLAEHSFIPENDYIEVENIVSLSNTGLMASTSHFTASPDESDITLNQSLIPKINTPKLSIDENSITLLIKGLPLIKGQKQPTIDGTITIKNPKASLDLKYENFKVDRFNLNIGMEFEQTLRYNSELNDLVDTSYKIPLGRSMPIPLAPPSPIPNMAFKAYLKIEVNTEGKIIYNVVAEESVSFSLVKKGKEIVPTRTLDASIDHNISDSGTVTAEIGLGEGFALEALGVIGIGLNGEEGLKIDFSYADYSDLKSTIFPKIDCSKIDIDSFIKLNFSVTLMDRIDLYSKDLARLDMPIGDLLDTCKKYTKLTMEPSPLKLSKGIEKEIIFYHHFFDIEEMEVKKEKVKFDDLEFFSDNDKFIEFKNGKIKVSKDFEGKEISLNVFFRFKNSNYGLDESFLISLEEEIKPIDPTWQGDWGRNEPHNGALLSINNLANGKFDFKLDASNGANIGLIEGEAVIQGQTAVFQDGNGCSITFIKNKSSITVEDNFSCQGYGGMGVDFNGEYRSGGLKKTELSLLNAGVFATKQQDDKFRKMVGKDYQLFAERMQIVSEGKDLDGFGVVVKKGFVRGLAGIMEAIIIYSKDGELLCAAVVVDSKVYYYSNVLEYQGILPVTFESWVKALGINNVIFKSKSKSVGSSETIINKGQLLNKRQLEIYSKYYEGRDPKESELKGTTPTDIFLMHWFGFETENLAMEYSLTNYDDHKLDYYQYKEYATQNRSERSKLIKVIKNNGEMTEKIINNTAFITIRVEKPEGIDSEYIFELKKNKYGYWKLLINH
jgi:hypothetical protein